MLIPCLNNHLLQTQTVQTVFPAISVYLHPHGQLPANGVLKTPTASAARTRNKPEQNEEADGYGIAHRSHFVQHQPDQQSCGEQQEAHDMKGFTSIAANPENRYFRNHEHPSTPCA